MTAPGWVFGYASLIWRQDFPFIEARAARIEGWTRRLWQGSHDHRGVASDPGRVATLIASAGDVCHGRAFLIEPEVFAHLDHREKNGYRRFDLTVYFEDGCAPGITYVAPPDNTAFLGAAPLPDMVDQIVRCRGESGRNVDYVLELARALRRLGIEDAHLFEIEASLLDRLDAGQASGSR
jgi:cation transport regulator ChaC